ncbi:MAG: glycyl-radical enzyme activating protein [Clostridia bacterium]|nr:glycyl-radical enzyme activating protein [Clostridia bacterium]
MTGVVFDVKEFALHDGSGLRTTVFLKGCPLRCAWCHNPEGMNPGRELARDLRKCKNCGLCRKPCGHEECRELGACVRICPENAVKAVGKIVSAEELARRLLKNREFLSEGGVTFSGGEPFLQTDFILETAALLPGVHLAAETSASVPPETFRRAADRMDELYVDVKLIDPREHEKWTGRPNGVILENVAWLLESGRRFTARVPLIPGVTDTPENLSGIARFLAPGAGRVKAELLPYNPMTGAKYRSVGRIYAPPFDENRPLRKDTAPFLAAGIEARAY